VYGTLLNHRSVLAALGDAANRPPYDAPPEAPVLYIKPRNTLARSGSVVRIPGRHPRTRSRCLLRPGHRPHGVPVSETRALDYVAGYLIVADVSIPHSNYHRPSIRFKARTGIARWDPRSPRAPPSRIPVR